jgi:hypothetical protein
MMGGARGGETGEGPRDETQDKFCSGRGQGERRGERQQTRDKREKGVWVQGSPKRGGCVAVAGASWELAGDGKREREGVRAWWARLGGSGCSGWTRWAHSITGGMLQAEVGLVGPCFAQAAPGLQTRRRQKQTSILREEQSRTPAMTGRQHNQGVP